MSDTPTILDERNALYRLVGRALGRLDAVDGWDEDAKVIPAERVQEIRRWLASEQAQIIDHRRAIIEGLNGP